MVRHHAMSAGPTFGAAEIKRCVHGMRSGVSGRLKGLSLRTNISFASTCLSEVISRSALQSHFAECGTKIRPCTYRFAQIII
eukprot:6482088-Amphidinium_carterae.2